MRQFLFKLFSNSLIVGGFAIAFPTLSFAAGTDTALNLANLYAQVFAPLDAFAKLLVPTGTMLIVALVGLHISVGGIMLAAGTTDAFDLAIKGMKLSLVASLALSAVTPQAWLGTMTGMGGAPTLPNAIMTGMHNLMSMAASASNDPWFRSLPASNSNGTASNGIMISGIFEGIISTLTNFLKIPLFSADQTAWGKLWAVLDGSFLGSLLFWIGSVFMFMLAAGMLLLELIGAELTIKFAIAFTPLMVPWILFKPMEFLFDAWLKSLIVGSIGFIVAMLMLSGFSAFAIEAAKGITAHSSDWTGYSTAMQFLPIFLGSFIFFMIAPKATSIAGGLVSGGGTAGINLHAFRGAVAGAVSAASAPKQLAGSAANAGNTAKSVAQTGMSSAKAVGGAATAAGGAYKAAKEGGAGNASSALSGAGAGAKAAFKSAMSSEPSAGTKSSPGGKATASVAAALGMQPSSKQFKTAALHANQVYSESRALGAGSAASMAKANTAARQSLAGVAKHKEPPKQSPTATGI